MLDQISKIGIIPVIKIEDEQQAVPLARALIDGGLPAAEITFRTKAAPHALSRIRDAFPDMLLCAGTVLSVDQAKLALDSGAKAIISPGLNPKVVSWCLEQNVCVIPGICTPSELEMALELGLKTVKFFPAEQSGGIAKIKAMSAPYAGVSFMPTGGIDLHNVNDYLSFQKVIACGGSFMVKDDLLRAGNFDEITHICRMAVDKMLDLKLAHIALKPTAAQSGQDIAETFAALLSVPVSIGKDSTFAGSAIEVLHTASDAACAQIVFSTRSLSRAVYHLEKRGFHFKPVSTAPDTQKQPSCAVMDGGIAGFEIRLIEK